MPASAVHRVCDRRKADAVPFGERAVPPLAGRVETPNLLGGGQGQLGRRPALNIHPLRDRLTVRRPHAGRNAAKVIEDEALADRPDLLLVHRGVRVPLAPADGDGAVTEPVHRVSPDPARRFVSAVLDRVVGRRDSPWPRALMMVREEPDVLPLHPALTPLRLRRSRGSLTAAALTEAVRVRAYALVHKIGRA